MRVPTMRLCSCRPVAGKDRSFRAASPLRDAAAAQVSGVLPASWFFSS